MLQMLVDGVRGIVKRLGGDQIQRNERSWLVHGTKLSGLGVPVLRSLLGLRFAPSELRNWKHK